MGRFVFVRDHTVEDRVLDGFFQDTDRLGRGKSECFHNFLACHRGLEVADTVFLFYIGELAAYLLEIG